MPQSDYEQRQEEKRERLARRAKQKQAESDARFGRADRLSKCMNGQPILVGHHSEKRHRRDIKRMDADWRKGSEAHQAAKHLERRATNLGKSGISGDDPEAIAKLEGRVSDLMRKRDHAKAVNQAYRRGGWHEVKRALKMNFDADAKAAEYKDKGVTDPPFPSWHLTNLGANIRRLNKRIADLTRLETVTYPDDSGNGWRVYFDEEENRVCCEVSERIPKDHPLRWHFRGWNWSRRFSRWQRKPTDNGLHSARELARELEKHYG